MRVLIAEDDLVSRRLLEKTLQNWRHDVVVAENGDQAWSLFAAKPFPLVISDWMMPERDGLDLCRMIRARKKPDYCYFILLTARTGVENLKEGMEAGIDDYLTKPLNIDELRFRMKVAERILSLQSDVRTLRGILPICAWCKKIRDDQEVWQPMERYVSTRSGADFTHTICPECSEQHMADLLDEQG